MRKQLPKTAECIQKIEDIISTLTSDPNVANEAEKSLTEEFMILCHPMLKLAQVIFCENPDWAVELAKYIAVMNNDQYINH